MRNALHLIIENPNKLSDLKVVGTLETLIKEGIDINAQDDEKFTPLNLACFYQNIYAFLILLDYGADTEIPNRFGDTPLMTTVIRGNYEMAKKLLEHGAKVDYTNKKYYTALIYAIRVNDIDMVKLLVNFGADVNHGTKKGRDPSYENPYVYPANFAFGKKEIWNYLADQGAYAPILGYLSDSPDMWDRRRKESTESAKSCLIA